MSFDPISPLEVTQAFEKGCIIVPIKSILPTRILRRNVQASQRYRQIEASIQEVGIIEPPVVTRDVGSSGTFLLLDGHLRLEILKAIGASDVECLISTDDEAFTYNKRISRLAAVQEYKMINRAIQRGVSEEKIAKALGMHIRSVTRKRRMLDGICEEAVALLKDKPCTMAVFQMLRKMQSLRQIEAAELLINANNYSTSYVSAILAGTPQAQLVDPDRPKQVGSLTPEAMERIERELSRLQAAIGSIQDTYGRDHLQLTIIKGYIARLLANARILKYLAHHRPEFIGEFQVIAEMTSTIPVEAA